MVIRGNIRGNGPQLAHYLLTEGGNEHIHILEVDGRVQASPAYLQQALHSMSLTAELTRTDKGLYHAQINPAYSEDKSMSADDWQRAADILGHELGLGEQRRVIVLHTKKDRTHAHVVFERYDHRTGKVIDNKFSRLAQDRARKEMERVFEHERTPHRNKHHPELKDRLTKLWQTTDNARDFIQAVNQEGCMLAEGVPRRPFMVVDENGRSFELVRQLKGVRIKEVRQRLRGASLIPEKEAIELMRQKKDGTSESGSSQQIQGDDKNKAFERTTAFFANKDDLVEQDPIEVKRQKQLHIAEMFLQASPKMTAPIQNDHPEKKKDTTPVETGSTELNEAHKEDRDQSKTEIWEDHRDPKDAHPTELTEGHEDHREVAKEQSRERLKVFILSQEEVTTPPKPSADQQRQQNIAQQFLSNEDMFAKHPQGDEPIIDADGQQEKTTVVVGFVDDQEKETPSADKGVQVRQLMQEQKELRERKRRRTKKPSR